jgi:photosystem II stability/assembly factor-like uncharacterized protein
MSLLRGGSTRAGRPVLSVGLAAVLAAGSGVLAARLVAPSAKRAASTTAACRWTTPSASDRPPSTATSLCVTAVEHASFGTASAAVSYEFEGVAASVTEPDFAAAGGIRCRHSCDGVLALTSDAGDSWRLENLGATLPAEIAFPTPLRGFVLGERAGAAGDSWPTPCGDNLGAPSPCPVLLATADGGSTWHHVETGSDPIWSMAFVAPHDGLVALDTCPASTRRPNAGIPSKGCPGRIERTTDAGASWQGVLTTPAPILALASLGQVVYAVEAQTGSYEPPTRPTWLRVLRSADGGTSWTAAGTVPISAAEPGMAVVPSDVELSLTLASPRVVALHVLALSSCAMHSCGLNSLFSTDDAGRSWVSDILAGVNEGCGMYPVSVLSPSPGRLLADMSGWDQCAGVGSVLVASSNGGSSWTRLARDPLGPFPASGAFADSDRGVGVLNGGVVVSDDGGRFFSQAFPAPVPTDTVDFVTSKVGFGAGTAVDPGAVLETSDGGAHWRQIGEIGDVGNVGGEALELDFTDALHGFALVEPSSPAAGQAEVLVTVDGGRKWRSTSLPSAAVQALGQGGLQVPVSLLHAASADSATLVLPPLIAPESGCLEPADSQPLSILSTTDAGREWRQHVVEVPGGGSSLYGVAMWGAEITVATGSFGCPVLLARSVDGGRRWLSLGEVPSPGAKTPGMPDYGLEQPSANELWLYLSSLGDMEGEPGQLALDAGLLHSADRGRTWTRVTLPASVLEARLVDSRLPVGLGPLGLDVLQSRPSEAWLLTGRSSFIGNGDVTLWRTVDGGLSWGAVAKS